MQHWLRQTVRKRQTYIHMYVLVESTVSWNFQLDGKMQWRLREFCLKFRTLSSSFCLSQLPVEFLLLLLLFQIVGVSGANFTQVVATPTKTIAQPYIPPLSSICLFAFSYSPCSSSATHNPWELHLHVWDAPWLLQLLLLLPLLTATVACLVSASLESRHCRHCFQQTCSFK